MDSQGSDKSLETQNSESSVKEQGYTEKLEDTKEEDSQEKLEVDDIRAVFGLGEKKKPVFVDLIDSSSHEDDDDYDIDDDDDIEDTHGEQPPSHRGA